MTDIFGFIWWVVSEHPFECIFSGAMLGMFVCMFVDDATFWASRGEP